MVTNASGTLTETLDYYPYGGVRLDTVVGPSTGVARKYIGQQYDAATALNYLNARYQNPAQGQFITQDPVFLGSPKKQDLQNPQGLNAYAYALDDPVSNEDPSGRESVQQIEQQIQQIEQDIQGLQEQLNNLGTYSQGIFQQGVQAAGQYATNHPIISGLAIAGVVGVGIYTGVLPGAEAIAGLGGLCEKFCTVAEEEAEDETILLNPSINISDDTLQHVVNGHTAEGVESAGNSIFNEGENITDLIKSGTQQPIEPQSWGNNFQRVFDVGRNIGTYNVAGQQTTVMTIITDPEGNLVTSFPGFPNR